MFGETIIAGLALKFGGKLLKSVFEGSFGKKFGETAAEKVIEKVTDVILGKAGANKPEDLDNLSEEKLREILKDVEGDMPKIISEFTQSTKNSLDFQEKEMSKDTPKEAFLVWAWRPAGMWMLISAWIYYIFAIPFVNMLTEKFQLAVSVSELLTVSGFFFSLYMGGHTIKYVADSFGGKKKDKHENNSNFSD